MPWWSWVWSTVCASAVVCRPESPSHETSVAFLFSFPAQTKRIFTPTHTFIVFRYSNWIMMFPLSHIQPSITASTDNNHRMLASVHKENILLHTHTKWVWNVYGRPNEIHTILYVIWIPWWRISTISVSVSLSLRKQDNDHGSNRTFTKITWSNRTEKHK